MEERYILDSLDNGRDLSELIELVEDIVDMVQTNPEQFVLNLRYALEDKCREEGCCPECGSTLEVIDTAYDCRGEFWGFPVNEVTHKYGCINCNYIER